MKHFQFSVRYRAVCGVIFVTNTCLFNSVDTELIFSGVKSKSSPNIKIPDELDLQECT